MFFLSRMRLRRFFTLFALPLLAIAFTPLPALAQSQPPAHKAPLAPAPPRS